MHFDIFKGTFCLLSKPWDCYVWIMVLEHVSCLLPEENTADCEIICHYVKKQNVNKVVVWLLYKVLSHCNCFQAKDGSGNWPEWVIFWKLI
jgi:hypothetical protein